MDYRTLREFMFTNPQDDPHLYPRLPPAYYYDIYGNVWPVRNLKAIKLRQTGGILRQKAANRRRCQ
jgi:hypothetical protein